MQRFQEYLYVVSILTFGLLLVLPEYADAQPARQQGGGAARGGRGPGARSFPIVPKKIDFEGKTWVADLAKEVEVVDYKGKKALHVVGGEMTYVYLPDVSFENGVIECDIAGPRFSGLAFRGREKGRKAEKVYFRPQNAGTQKHQNTVQYAVIGNPQGTWMYLRKNSPGRYETGADIQPNEWFHARLEISGKTLKVYVNDGKKPLLTVDPMLSSASKGTVGVWGHDTYFANFRFSPRPNQPTQ